mgnify:CR=1 FL=1
MIDRTSRCCIGCGHRYRGGVQCPRCPGNGEPMPNGGARPGAGRPAQPEPRTAEELVAWLAGRKLPIEARDVDNRIVLEFSEAKKLCRLAGMGR